MTVKATKLGPGKLALTASGDSPGSPVDFSAQCRKTEWSPDYKAEDPIDMLSGDQYAEEGKLTSTISGEMLQDYGANSLLKFCNDNAGKEFKFEFIPANSGKLKLSGNLQVTPVSVGGDAGKTNWTSFTFPCIGSVSMDENSSPVH